MQIAALGQARGTVRRVPRNTCCRHQPNPTPQTMTIPRHRPADTSEHKSTWNHSHTTPHVDPSCSLHNPPIPFPNPT